ncbi:MAG: hypothetical protein CVU56_16310 [Deltaproteobacteria bacterium HGW-Deltaproteobacteria-14]|nr:MAG: hypothetical protein CVU56_16310 [Deltaproteobacteria bacterium HGW-Deltaproteobacteria-14]
MAGALSLLATLALPLLAGDEPDRTTRAPNAYSKSAVGHHALVTVLRELGLPVLVSRYRSASRAGPGQPLVIAEPTGHSDEELVDMIAEALGNDADVVLVLPKWDPDDWDPPRADEVEVEGGGPLSELTPEAGPEPAERVPQLLPVEDVAHVLNLADRAVARATGRPPPETEYEGGVITRGDRATGWVGPVARYGTPSLEQLQGIRLDLEPELALEDPADDGTILIGSWPVTTSFIYFVSDPELFDTMGLGRGDNAVLTYRFFVDTLGARGLIFDEVVHGFKKPPSIWSDLFSFPLVVLTFHLIGLLALGLWAAGARFGKPDRLPPRVAPGKAALISNTATLLAVGGHVGYGLREYLKSTLRAVARDYALPARLDDQERLATLARLASERGVSEDPVALAQRVLQVPDSKREGRRALALARRIYRFRMEMTDGHHKD